jgi:hypothetical protein
VITTSQKPGVLAERYVKRAGQYYLLTRSKNSIFTTRFGKQDYIIRRRISIEECARTGGSREDDGYRYHLIAMYAAETGEILRSYEPHPFTIEDLCAI